MNLISLWWEYNARKWHRAYDAEHTKLLDLVSLVHTADENSQKRSIEASINGDRVRLLEDTLDAAGLLDLVS